MSTPRTTSKGMSEYGRMQPTKLPLWVTEPKIYRQKQKKKTWKGRPKLVGNKCNNCYMNYREICIANRSFIISATLNLNHIDIQEIKRRSLCRMEWFYINVLKIETGIDAVRGCNPVAINTWHVSFVTYQNPNDNTWFQGNKFLF